MLNVDELEDLYADVLGRLTVLVGVKKLRDWGFMNIKDMVRDHAEQGEVSASKIARLIFEEFQLEVA